MIRNGFNPTSRSRHIGTKARGHGKDNKLVIPEPRRADRIWWEQLSACAIQSHKIAGQNVQFIVEQLKKDFYHAASVADLVYLLSHIPINDWEGIGAVVLRQSTRKQLTLAPTWGRVAFASNIGIVGKPDIY